VNDEVAEIERQFIEAAAGDEGTARPPTALTKEEIQEIFVQALDLQGGYIGYVEARNRLVAAAGTLDHEEVLSNLPPGPRDLTRSKQAANAGHKGAMYALALFDLHEGLPENRSEKLKWCLRAAVNGHAEAQTTMGSHYWYRGEDGHPINNTKALIWKRLAMAHGAIEFPDPCGDFLSANSFRHGLHDLVHEGRRLYLDKCHPSMDDDGEYEQKEIETLAATCGCGGPILSRLGMMMYHDYFERCEA